jgi:glyoxylase I family protein
MFGKSKLGAICYYVSDIARTETFYRDVLGLDVERMEDDGDGHTWLMARTANSVELIFFQQESRPGNSPIAVFDLPDGGIDDVVAALAGKGVTIVTPVSHAPGGWSANVADPDGHTISMYQSESVPRSLK